MRVFNNGFIAIVIKMDEEGRVRVDINHATNYTHMIFTLTQGEAIELIDHLVEECT